jgi:hypothetical protein
MHPREIGPGVQVWTVHRTGFIVNGAGALYAPQTDWVAHNRRQPKNSYIHNKVISFNRP